MRGLSNWIRKTNSLSFIFFILIQVLSNNIGAQTSVDQNQPQNPGGNPPFNFLGWEATVATELDITHHTQGQPIVFGTSGTERMRIQPDGRVRMGVSNITQPAQLGIYPEATTEKGLEATISGYDQVGFSHGLNITLGNANYLTGIEVNSWGVANSKQQYGVYGFAIGAASNIGVLGVGAATPNDFAGYFNGAVAIAGTFAQSDSLLKRNVQPFDYAGNMLSALHPVKFNFVNHTVLNLPQTTQFGFVAQEVLEVLPNSVREIPFLPELSSGNGEVNEIGSYLSLNYLDFVPVLIAGSQLHYSQIQEIGGELIELQERLDGVQMLLETLEIE